MRAALLPARAERHPHLLTSKPLPSCVLLPPPEGPYVAGPGDPGDVRVRVAEVAGRAAANDGAAAGASPSEVILA